MAVSAAPGRPVTAGQFVRLKILLTRNGLRGRPVRVALFAFGVAVGAFAAVGGFVLCTEATLLGGDFGVVVAGFAGTGLTLGWALLPLLFFGVDETIDPARFALLPVPRPVLLRGMAAAACVSVPAVVTALALGGLAFGGLLRAGPGPAVVAVAAVAVAVLQCVLGSRAVTSAFASMLRSRRVRDLAAILLALVASAVAPLQFLVSALIAHGDVERAARIARVLAWTPLAAPYAVPLDAVQGDWQAASGRLAIGLATVIALVAWWSATLESAMIGTVAGAGDRTRHGPAPTPVTGLFPALLRPLRPGRFTGLMAREWRYWWRDPRRRAGILSLTIAGVVLPAALRAGVETGPVRTPLASSVAFSAVLAAMVLSNQFGNDGSAYALHLLVGVPGRVELRARSLALVLIMGPLLVVATVAVGVLTGGAGQLLAALGTVAAGVGVSAGVAATLSVLAPYAFPDSTNPFAVGGGTAGLRGLLAAVGSFCALVLALPLLLLALLTHGTVAGLVVLAAGTVWGAAGLLLGTRIAGGILDRRGPEILAAVTPRR